MISTGSVLCEATVSNSNPIVHEVVSSPWFFKIMIEGDDTISKYKAIVQRRSNFTLNM